MDDRGMSSLNDIIQKHLHQLMFSCFKGQLIVPRFKHQLMFPRFKGWLMFPPLKGCLVTVGCNNGNTSLLELSDSLSVRLFLIYTFTKFCNMIFHFRMCHRISYKILVCLGFRVGWKNKVLVWNLLLLVSRPALIAWNFLILVWLQECHRNEKSSVTAMFEREVIFSSQMLCAS